VGGVLFGVRFHELAGGEVEFFFKLVEGFLETGHLVPEDVDVALEEVVEEFHLVEAAVEFLLLHEVQLEVLMSAEEAALDHRVAQFEQELAQLLLGQVHQILRLGVTALEGSEDTCVLLLALRQLVPGLAEVFNQFGQLLVQVAATPARVQDIEHHSSLLVLEEIGEEFAERDAGDQRVALGDSEDSLLEAQFLL